MVQELEECFFENQEKGERVILLLRAHPITLAPTVIFIVILLFVPLFFTPVASLVLPSTLLNLSGNQKALIVIFWYLLVIGFSLYRYIFWYFNVYLLTNERVVDFDFDGILRKETAYAKLNHIQDVSPKVAGFLQTLFDYGDIRLQTAAEVPDLYFENVAHPEAVSKAVLDEIRKEEKEPLGVVA